MSGEFESTGHSFTEGGHYDEAYDGHGRPVQHVKKSDGWISVQGPEDLPQIKGSAKCWIFLDGKVQLATYQSKHFIVAAEYGLLPWNMISAYQLIQQPEPPLF